MLRTVKNVSAALALAGLVISQPVMAAKSSAASANGRVGTPMGHTEHVAGAPVVGWLLAALIVAGVIAIIANDHSEAKSPVSP